MEKKKLNLMRKLRKNRKAIDIYRQLYNELCRECQVKVVKNPKMDIEEYCDTCKEKASAKMEQVKCLLS